jgi:hypothetical protein
MAKPLLRFSGVAHRLSQWAQHIPEKEWAVYETVLDGASRRSIPFALGGAFAVATYTGYWRNTKDLDLYVLPEYRDRMIELLTDLGMVDYYDTRGYDRWWIYRATRDDTIVDVIWAMANHRAQIDELWMSGPEVSLHGRCVKVLPAEAMLWDKLYIMQRERCDWPDVLNLLYAAGAEVDWEYLLARIGDDLPLMAGALSVFRWLAPRHAEQLPSWIWAKVGLESGAPAATDVDYVKRRVDLLDRRPWFGPERARLEPAA